MRARIDVLSQIPNEWNERVRRWRSLNRQFKVDLDAETTAPDRNEEYFIYQTLVGAWPRSSTVDDEFIERLRNYMVKALHEAKVHSSWIMPDSSYDNAVCSFVASILKSNDFLGDMKSFQDQIRPFALLNSLSQTLIRCLAPGVPDTFQGTETWNDRLVDPDNRCPVKFEELVAKLDQIHAITQQEPRKRAEALRRSVMTDIGKMLITSLALRLRRDHATLFESGDYLPLSIDGPDQNKLFAFAMINERKAVIVAVPRLLDPTNLSEDGSSIIVDANLILPNDLSGRQWQDAMTNLPVEKGQIKLPAAELFSNMPVVVLLSS